MFNRSIPAIATALNVVTDPETYAPHPALRAAAWDVLLDARGCRSNLTHPPAASDLAHALSLTERDRIARIHARADQIGHPAPKGGAA